MTRVVLVPKARAELNAITRYYRREAGQEVEGRFLDEFRRATTLLQQHPEAAPAAGPEGVRKKVLAGSFHFSFWYVVLPDRLRILAIRHQRRKPGEEVAPRR